LRPQQVGCLRRWLVQVLPALEIGWLNGWILLAVEVLIQGFSLLVFPKHVVARLFDRSGWSGKQRVFTVMGKMSSLACLILIILTPLQTNSSAFLAGLIAYGIGLAGLVVAMLDFRDTPLDQPATKGLYKISRHPQIVALFVVFLGICVAIGSWAALFTLVMSKLLQHLGILAEEEACLRRYGEPYRVYMKQVPRYLLFL
jgi:protein-S-isoprenylcysteine O-methyltransferase Ste14